MHADAEIVHDVLTPFRALMVIAVSGDRGYRAIREPLDNPAILVALATMWAPDVIRKNPLTPSGRFPGPVQFTVTIEQAAITCAKVLKHWYT